MVAPPHRGAEAYRKTGSAGLVPEGRSPYRESQSALLLAVVGLRDSAGSGINDWHGQMAGWPSPGGISARPRASVSDG